jgi:nucleoside phosphorylase
VIVPDTPFTSSNRITKRVASAVQHSKAKQNKVWRSQYHRIWTLEDAPRQWEKKKDRKRQEMDASSWIRICQARSSSLILVRPDTTWPDEASVDNERQEMDTSSWICQARSSSLILVRPDTA